MDSEIGPRLRAARIARRLSLRAVGSAVGVSASLISQVETGKTQPSVSTLYALVTYLGLSFDDLLGDPSQSASETGPAAPAGQPGQITQAPDAPARSVIQAGSDNPVIEMQNGVRWERLSTTPGSPVDPMLVTYQPGASSSVEGTLMRHNGTEFAYLFEGELTVHLDFDTLRFRSGDSLTFASIRPHMYVNHGSVPARGLWYVVGRRDEARAVPVSAPDFAPRQTDPSSAVDVLRAMDQLR